MVDGNPRFLCYNLDTDTICVKKQFEEEEKIIRPLESHECGYLPYNYTKDEIEELMRTQLSKEELLDYIKQQIDRFIVASELDKHLILGDILVSYCQEQINTVHYPFFVGETESGKSSVTHLFKWLAYRCLYGEDIPNADIYNFLGTEEEGAGTIAEDEAQEIEKSREKIRTYKNSYSKGSVKPRIITTNYSKTQVYYKTFCLKVFAGEKIPDDKGFRERLAVVNMLEGTPQSNIKRLTPEERAELIKLRNKILVWKVQNIKKGIQRNDSGLKQRDQELWEDFLSVTWKTKYHEKCRETVLYYTKKRHEAIWNSLEARIFKIVLQNLNPNLELRLESFWEYLVNMQDEFTGSLEKETFYPHDFAEKVTRNYLSRLFEDKYDARKKQAYKIGEEGKKHLRTVYAFKEEVVKVLTKKYNIRNVPSKVITSGGGGGSGQLNLEDSNHVDHVDHLKKIPAKEQPDGLVVSEDGNN
ncbi:MAG: conserved hypothetical protein [Marine Group I thaumarchaeote]|nr:MAG: conserved hypothetical protein [Marine Group I thaumarchaeote]